MNKSNILKTFNNHFEEFVCDVLRVFPNDNDIIACKEALMTMRKGNPKLIIDVFKINVVNPYRDKIIKNDISFFIDKQYNNDLYSENTCKILEKINILREPIRNMESDDKNKVLKYMNNLLKLCDLYN